MKKISIQTIIEILASKGKASFIKKDEIFSKEGRRVYVFLDTGTNDGEYILLAIETDDNEKVTQSRRSFNKLQPLIYYDMEAQQIIGIVPDIYRLINDIITEAKLQTVR